MNLLKNIFRKRAATACCGSDCCKDGSCTCKDCACGTGCCAPAKQTEASSCCGK